MKARIIKAIPHTRLPDLGGLKAHVKDKAAPPEYFLVDTQAKEGAFGGTGQVFDWGLLARHPLPRPFFLAGGLGPHNLAEALKAKPFAVDLNSKVEIAPGRKDIKKVEACLKIALG
jgi:phosphoribosylanthranilate isomerase